MVSDNQVLRILRFLYDARHRVQGFPTKYADDGVGQQLNVGSTTNRDLLRHYVQLNWRPTGIGTIVSEASYAEE